MTCFVYALSLDDGLNWKLNLDRSVFCPSRKFSDWNSGPVEMATVLELDDKLVLFYSSCPLWFNLRYQMGAVRLPLMGR